VETTHPARCLCASHDFDTARRAIGASEADEGATLIASDEVGQTVPPPSSVGVVMYSGPGGRREHACGEPVGILAFALTLPVVQVPVVTQAPLHNQDAIDDRHGW
jgi:hypothetical protein